MTLPANQPVFAWPNLDTPQYGAVNTRTKTLRTPTHSGGSWSGGTPLSNLTLPQRYQRVVRSSSAAAAESVIVTDFGRAVNASVFALVGHNLTPAVGWSRWRVRLATTNSFPANLVTSPDALATGWTPGGTGTVTNAASSFLGRDYTNVVNTSNYQVARTVTLTGDGTKRFSILVHANGPGSFKCGIYDNTASVYRGAALITIDGPGAVTAVAANGALSCAVESMDGGLNYCVSLLAPSCVAAHANAVFAFDAVGVSGPAAAVRLSRVTVEDLPATVVIDSGWQNAFQPFHDALSFPSGVTVDSLTGPTIDELIHYQALSAVFVNPTWQVGQYRKIEVDDTTNTDGFIELTSFAGPGYFFPTWAEVGLNITWKDRTIAEDNDFGIRRYNPQGRRREGDLGQHFLTRGQAMWPFRMEGRLGIGQELFCAIDPNDPNYQIDLSFLCTLQETSGVSYAASVYLDKTHKLVEKI